jgi:hypothetical protein
MSAPVYIECESVDSMLPVGSTGTRAIALDLNMTRRQCRDVVFNILRNMPEQEAFEWLRSEFADWFKVPA